MSFAVAAIGVGVGVAKLFGASKRKKAAKKAAAKAAKELAAKKKQYENLDTSNLAANMENKMEDLTINQKGMDVQSNKAAASRANIMDSMNAAAGGSGIAALAQTMANQGSDDAAKSGAMIGDQEAAQSVTITGLQFQVVAKPQPAATKKATITIVGNETGGRTTINLTVEKQDLETTPGVSLQAK